jgi:hypothetical protein
MLSFIYAKYLNKNENVFQLPIRTQNFGPQHFKVLGLFSTQIFIWLPRESWMDAMIICKARYCSLTMLYWVFNLCKFEGLIWFIKWTECRWKQSWPILIYHACICLERLRKITKILSRITGRCVFGKVQWNGAHLEFNNTQLISSQVNWKDASKIYLQSKV